MAANLNLRHVRDLKIGRLAPTKPPIAATAAFVPGKNASASVDA
jgi:hypothetical protein